MVRDIAAKVNTVWDDSVVPHPLSGVQATAFDLYCRGFNVFPLPSAREWQSLAAENPGDENKKPPYLLKPLLLNRLHCCGPGCIHLPQGKAFLDLFTQANIGVMTGRTSGNLIGIDCDSQASFMTIGHELTQRNLPYWAIGSHRGGAYLMRLAEGESTNMPATHYQDVQVWGNAHYLVLPPSVHPFGTVYRWVSPEPRYSLPEGLSLPMASISSLDWLGVSLANRTRRKWQDTEKYDLPAWAGNLSRRNRETLALGVPEGQRNQRLTAAAYDLAGNDIPYHDAESIIVAAAGRCIPPYPVRDSLAILKSAYSKDRQPARQSGLTTKSWQKALNFAETYDWRSHYGRVTLKRRAVFLACVERSRRDDSETWRGSVRELSEMANQGTNAIQAALHDFQRDGLIKWIGRSSNSGANLFSFSQCTAGDTLPPPCSNSVSPTDTPETSAEKDVFGRLGLTTWQVWRYLLRIPSRNPGQIARGLNLPRSSAYDALKRLQAYGLVTFNSAECLYFGESCSNSDLENLSVNLGVFGKSEWRKQMYISEREKRCNVLVANARDGWAEHEAYKARTTVGNGTGRN